MSYQSPSSFFLQFDFCVCVGFSSPIYCPGKKQTSQGMTVGVVFTGTIDGQYLCGESLVDFLLPYGSPRTCSRQKEKAEFLRISNGSVFSIAIKIFPVSQKFFISDRSILCIDSRSNKYPDVF